MHEGARQLAFDLPVEPRYGDEDFLVGDANRTAFGTVGRWPDWPDPALLIRGGAGSGKSHLAAIWAARAGASTVRAAAVSNATVADLAARPALVVEDIDRGPMDEPALFHLVNRLRERGTPLLLTSRTSVERSGLATPDLLSRLRRAPSVSIGPPDDDLLRAVLVKLFGDRPLLVDASVVDYLALRIERSLAAAAAAVAALDREALSRGRRVTRAVAAAIVPSRDEEADPDGEADAT